MHCTEYEHVILLLTAKSCESLLKKLYCVPNLWNVLDSTQQQYFIIVSSKSILGMEKT